MSMMGRLRSVHAGVIDVAWRDPTLTRLLATFALDVPKPFVPDPNFLANLSPSLRAGVEAAAALQAASTGTAGVEQLAQAGVAPDDLDPPLSLDKGWHAVHFIITRNQSEPALPPGNAVLGGREVGPDLGYGPLRVMPPGEVADTARALLDLDLPALVNRTSREELDRAEIYPGGWTTHASLDWLRLSLENLRTYFQGAAERERGMLLFIS